MKPSAAQVPTSSVHAFRTFRTMSRRPPTVPVCPLVAVFLFEPSRRPVVVRRVAAARAMEGRDVLQGNEDVAVQLDVSDVLHVAVGRQDALLVLATEEGNLHLLALVLVRVVLHLG